MDQVSCLLNVGGRSIVFYNRVCHIPRACAKVTQFKRDTRASCSITTSQASQGMAADHENTHYQWHNKSAVGKFCRNPFS